MVYHANMSGGITRTKDGAPGWSGDPASWSEYKTASTKVELRYTCGPRLAAELGGAAKTAIQRSTWLSESNGAEKLLKHLQQSLGEPPLPEVANHMRQYFRVLRRRKGEAMTAFCVRHREDYDRMCRALGRMAKERSSTSTSTSFRSASHTRSSAPSEGESVQSGGPEATTTNEAEGPPADSNGGGDQWQDQYWTNWNSWGYAWYGWQARWWQRTSWSQGDWTWANRTSAAHEEQDKEDDMIQVLPDQVQGWFLLDKCGLDPLERSVIQGDLKSNFTLAGVENALTLTPGRFQNMDPLASAVPFVHVRFQKTDEVPFLDKQQMAHDHAARRKSRRNSCFTPSD